MKKTKRSISEIHFSDPRVAVRALLTPFLREIREAREKRRRNFEFLKALAHFKFVPGEAYSNRLRRYTVLAIRGPTLIVRYDDGTVDELSAETQRRIIEDIALEQNAAREDGDRCRPKRRTPARASEKVGLQPTTVRLGKLLWPCPSRSSQGGQPSA